MTARHRCRTALATLLALVGLVGCASFEGLQGSLIFRPTDAQLAIDTPALTDMQERWIDFTSAESGKPVRLHGLWQEAASGAPDAPVILFLHGARWDVTSSSYRFRRLRELGFAVLGIDYRGFGKSSPDRPTETLAYEDARAAWAWLARQHPGRARYVYGHSLGGAIAIDLASQVSDEQGVIVEGTFTSIPDVFSSFSFGWLPVTPIITQRFASVEKVSRLGSPLLVLHGDKDRLIEPTLGRRLFDAAAEPKRFVLLEGGTHRNAQHADASKYAPALAELFRLPRAER